MGCSGRALHGLMAALALWSSSGAAGQASQIDAAAVAATVDPLIETARRSSGMPGAAFIFVQGGHVVYQRGYGAADARSTPVNPQRTVWPIASITKVVTAIAALQLVERGRLGLDRDVNASLRRLQVPADGYPPITLRHLLSHTAALDELPGRQFDGARPADMAAFLRTRLRRYRPPGLATAYGTYGIFLAGVLVEDASGEPYAQYVRRHILAPLGMRHSRIMASRGDERGVAQGYALDGGRARPIAHEFYVSRPTSSMVASASDMGRLLIALLADGRREGDARLLAAGSMRWMLTQQAAIHPAIPGWSLGLQLDRANGLAIAEHGGDIGGFSSLLVLIPEQDAGFFIVTHGEGNDLRFQVRQALLDRFWPAAPRAVPAPRAEDSARLAEYAGRYQNSMSCRSCPDATANAFLLEAPGDGMLRLWGQRWLPVERDLFVRDDGRRLLGFSRRPDGRIASVSGGSWRVADRLD